MAKNEEHAGIVGTSDQWRPQHVTDRGLRRTYMYHIIPRPVYYALLVGLKQTVSFLCKYIISRDIIPNWFEIQGVVVYSTTTTV